MHAEDGRIGAESVVEINVVAVRRPLEGADLGSGEVGPSLGTKGKEAELVAGRPPPGALWVDEVFGVGNVGQGLRSEVEEFVVG